MNASANNPTILAPAGNRESFLAAIAAGADAIYCGLKTFSARMAAKNFQPSELFQLTSLAHDHGVDVYVTLNSLVKPDDCDELYRLVGQLNGKHQPDAFIVQDLAAIRIVKDAGYTGVYHALRLREGMDSGLSPENRKRSIRNFQEAGLKVGTCVEPVGPEHANEELADMILFTASINPSYSGAARRITIPGTEMAKLGMINELRMSEFEANISARIKHKHHCHISS